MRKSAAMTLNPWGPKAAHCVVAGFTQDTAGTTWTNSGSARHAHLAVDGTYSSTPTYGSDAEGEYALMTSSLITLLTNGTGDDIWLPRGTLILRAAYPGSATSIVHHLVSSNGPTANYGLSISRTGSASNFQIRLRVNDGATQRSYLAPDVGSAITDYAVRIGPTYGFGAWVNGVAATAETGSPASYTGPVKITAAQSFIIGGSAGSPSGIRLYQFLFWPLELDDEELARYWADPYIMGRPAVTGRLAHLANPWLGRLSSSSVAGRVCADRALSGTEYVRAKVASTAYGLRTASEAARVELAAADRAADIVVSSLTAGQEYRIAFERSADGATWTPMPGGAGVFTTDPGRGWGGTTKIAFYGDSHSGATAGGGNPPLARGSAIMFNDTAPPYTTIANRHKHLAYERALEDMRAWGPHLSVNGGDEYFPHNDTTNSTADDTTAKRDTAESVTAKSELLTTRAPGLFIRGNHDDSPRWWQAAANGTRAHQKQGTRRAKKMVCNPGNGPNIGNEWLNALGSVRNAGGTFDAAYRSTFVTDADNINADPFEDCWVQDFGDARIIGADFMRTSELQGGASEEDVNSRDNPDKFRFGATRLAWIERQLSESRHAVKFLCMHHLPGGAYRYSTTAGWYGWESGLRAIDKAYYETTHSTTYPIDQGRVHRLAKRYGAIVVLFHSHHYCVLVNDGVVYLTVPTVGAPSHSVNVDGFQNTDHTFSFGTAESLGSVDHLGNSLAAYIVKMYNVMGWVRAEVTGSQVVLTLRCTHRYTHVSGYESAQFRDCNPINERFAANAALTPSAGAVTLTEVPQQVYAVYEDASLTGSWWSSPPASRYTAGRREWSPGLSVDIGTVVVKPGGADPPIQFRCTAAGTGTTHTVAPTWPLEEGDTVVEATTGVEWTAEALKRAHPLDVDRDYSDIPLDDSGSASVGVSSATSGDVRVVYTPATLHTYTVNVAPNADVDVSDIQSMRGAAMKLYTLQISADPVDGSFAESIDGVSGEILMVRYVENAISPLFAGGTLAIAVESPAQTVLSLAVSGTGQWMPRRGTSGTDGVQSVYASGGQVVRERICVSGAKINVSSSTAEPGGLGTILIWVR